MFITLVLGLGLTLALLWLLGGGMPNVAHAQGPDGYSTYYVAPGGSCGGMTPCFSSVQAAVDAVDAPGDVVKVAASTYTGVQGRPAPVGYDGPSVITQVVYISKTVTIRGGYTTAFTDSPNPETNPTTLDAQEQGRVIFITGDVSPTIEGLRITGGDADGLGGEAASWHVGGGVCIFSATATISNSQVFSNTAYKGGGLYLSNSDTTLAHNTITSNRAFGGGGLYLVVSDGAILSRNSISGNTANGSSFGGGGLLLNCSDAMLRGNVIISNTARGYQGVGGGLYLLYSAATLHNNVVANNQAASKGDGVFIRQCSPHLLHTTIACNTGGDGSGVYAHLGTVALTNTILVSHTVGIYLDLSKVKLNATLWHGNTTDWGGAGTINHSNDYTGDPLFDADGYHLMDGSAAIDKGVDAGVTTDIDDGLRDSAPDLGADEFGSTSTPAGNIYLPIVLKGYPP